MILKASSIPRLKYIELFKWLSEAEHNPQVSRGELTNSHPVCFITKSAEEHPCNNGIFWDVTFEISSETPKDKLSPFINKVAEAQII